ncbi:MAG: hypothetical protein QMB55_04100 [Propionivibrio sp.]
MGEKVYSAPTFGLTFDNIPLINLRLEFNRTYQFIHSPEAGEILRTPIKQIQTPLFIWNGMSEDCMTLLLQRAILGVEAYLPGALKHTSAVLGNLSKELFEKLDAPFSFGAKSAVANIYHRMPEAVHPELSLRHLEQQLYETTIAFYREVRNPIFHGQQLCNSDLSKIQYAFLHVARIYEWIDHWFDPENLVPGGKALSGAHLCGPIGTGHAAT